MDLVDSSFLKLRGEIKGPPDTPFDGGKYILDIVIPETYPFNPPKVSVPRVCVTCVTSIVGRSKSYWFSNY